jgi:thiamine-monophosphate kinase
MNSTGSEGPLVGDLGEKRLIQEVLGAWATTAAPDATEDCIIIDPARLFGQQDSPLIVYSVDHASLIDRPMPTGFGWRYHGRWLAACTCNDVLAMGARPRGLALDLAVPPDLPVARVRELYMGITDVLTEYGTALEGGNTDINNRTETVGMCWGTVSRGGLIRRRGARLGDVVAVTTELGIGWASFLLRKLGRFAKLGPESQAALEDYNLLPLAPHHAIAETGERLPGAVTSGMDLSDGLAEFLYLVARSGLGVRLDTAALPASPLLRECADLLGVPPAMLAVEYGFDMPRAHGYTIAPDQWDAVKAVFESHRWPLFRIGEVVSGDRVYWDGPSGRREDLPAFWDDKCHRLGAVERWLAMVERGVGVR